MATRDFANVVQLVPDDASRLAILVEELITNLYEHGGLGDENVLSLRIHVTDAEIDLLLTDPGRSFDPLAVPKAIPSRGGGAGLKLARAWAERIDYQSSEGINRFRLVLPRSA